jgi:putative endonuclease
MRPAGRCPRARGGVIVRAAQYWLAGHPDFAGHDIAFDVVLGAPWAWPQYIENAFPV